MPVSAAPVIPSISAGRSAVANQRWLNIPVAASKASCRVVESATMRLTLGDPAPDVIVVYGQRVTSKRTIPVTVYVFARAGKGITANFRVLPPRKATQVHHGATSP